LRSITTFTNLALLKLYHEFPGAVLLVRPHRFSIHAQQERLEEDLDVTEIEAALMQGEIVEAYPEDPRGESCLVLGYAGAKPIHAVLGWASIRGEDEDILRIITVYIPQPPKWHDPRTRGRRP
jgi:Domain of unknown function (DUF4258)